MNKIEQYLSIRYTERLAEAGASVSVGSKGDSYDNALAEAVNGLYKTELVERHGPWRSLDDLELATLEYIDRLNHRRLHSACDGQIRDLHATIDDEAAARLTIDNTTLKQRVRQLSGEHRTLEERLNAARTNLRFADRRIAAL